MLLIIIAIAASIGLAAYIWQHRLTTGMRPLLALCLAVTLWSFGYSQELRTAELTTVYLWAKIQYLGIVILPVAWFYLALEYTGRDQWLNRHMLLLTSIIPGLTLLIVWLYDPLIWRTTTLTKVGPYFVFDPIYGPWFWVHSAYSYLLLLAGSLMLGRMAMRTFSLYRGQTTSLLLAALAPWLSNFLYLSGQSQLDLTPFAFSFSLFIFTWGVLRFKLLDITPIARNLLIETMQDSVIVLDRQDQVVDVNMAALKLMGQAAEEVIGRSATELFAQWDYDFHAYQEKPEINDTITVTTADKTIFLALTSSPIKQARHSLGQLLILHDITDYTQVEAAYQQTLQQLQARTNELELLHQMGLDLAATLNLDKVLEIIMAVAVDLLDADMGSLFLYQHENNTLTLAARFHLDPLPLGHEIEINQGLVGKVWQHNKPLLINNYQEWAEHLPKMAEAIGERACMGIPIWHGTNKVGVLAMTAKHGRFFTQHDIDLFTLFVPDAALAIHNARLYQQSQTELANRRQVEAQLRASELDYKQAVDQLRQLALYDSLTGLPNRRLLMRDLDEMIQQRDQRHFSLLFLDIDRFKVINDNLGHRIGDALLVAIARLLESCVRHHDTVARLGGDEFVILLCGTESNMEAQRIAERILEQIAQPFFLEGHTVYTSASIGLIMHTAHYQDPDEVLRHADIAMYQAKLRGKARYEIFDLSQQSQVANLWQIESDLHHALAKAELVVYYQPIVSLADGRLKSIEALVRWQHPQRGLLEPNVFLPIAEEAGLLVALNEWVLQQACQQLQQWHQAGYGPLRLTMNIPAVQLQQDNAIRFIQETLEQASLPYYTLGLEITERFSARTTEHISALTKLHDLGMGVLIDDFGIGSSLESLKLFPLDYLKINQAFVQDMAHDTNDQAIITAIIAMAHSLGIQVIAEGVETAEQLIYLQAEGCDEAQGYFIAMPMSAVDMGHWLQQEDSHALELIAPSKALDVTIRAHFAKDIGYALVDENLCVIKSNDVMRQWITANVVKLEGQRVTEIFPVLIGQEEMMRELIRTPRAESLLLSRIYCPGANAFGRYYDLRIEPFISDEAVLLLLVQDATYQAQKEFILRQQLNELRLQLKA